MEQMQILLAILVLLPFVSALLLALCGSDRMRRLIVYGSAGVLMISAVAFAVCFFSGENLQLRFLQSGGIIDHTMLALEAGFAVLIIGMVTRTALGHLGRPLRADGSIVVMYVLVLAAALLRLLALLPAGLPQAALHASALAWVLAFALYLWRFVPLLIRPRLPPAGLSAAQPSGHVVSKSRKSV